MMLPEPTEFPKTPLTSFSDVVNQFGISAEDMRKGITTITRTNLDADVDLIGFNYSVKSDNHLIINSDLIPDVIYSRPEPIQELHNCNNCGGTVDEEGYCRYCGSRVYFFGEHKPRVHGDLGF